MVKDELKKYFFNTSWMALEHFVKIIAAIFVTAYVARYLGASQFGVFSYALAFVVIVESLSKLGLDNILVRELVRRPEEKSILLGTAFRLRVFSAAASFLVLMGVSFLETDRVSSQILQIFTLAVLCQPFDLADQYYQSLVHYKVISKIRVAAVFVVSIFKVWGVYLGYSLSFFVWMFVLESFLRGILFFYLLTISQDLKYLTTFSKGVAKRFAKDCWPELCSGFMWLLYMRTDQVMIKNILEESSSVGIYSVVVRLTEAWGFIPVILGNSLFPKIVSIKKSGSQKYRTMLRQFYQVNIYIALVIISLCLIFSEKVILTLYGPAYIEASSVLKLHIWSLLFVSMFISSARWFFVENLQIYRLLFTLCGLLFNILLNFIFIKRYGLFGASFASVVSMSLPGYFLLFCHSKTKSVFYDLTRSFVPIGFHSKDFWVKDR